MRRRHLQQVLVTSLLRHVPAQMLHIVYCTQWRDAVLFLHFKYLRRCSPPDFCFFSALSTLICRALHLSVFFPVGALYFIAHDSVRPIIVCHVAKCRKVRLASLHKPLDYVLIWRTLSLNANSFIYRFFPSILRTFWRTNSMRWFHTKSRRYVDCVERGRNYKLTASTVNRSRGLCTAYLVVVFVCLCVCK